MFGGIPSIFLPDLIWLVLTDLQCVLSLVVYCLMLPLALGRKMAREKLKTLSLLFTFSNQIITCLFLVNNKNMVK